MTRCQSDSPFYVPYDIINVPIAHCRKNRRNLYELFFQSVSIKVAQNHLSDLPANQVSLGILHFMICNIVFAKGKKY